MSADVSRPSVPAASRGGRLDRMLRAALVLAVGLFVWRHYYIKSYSDPLNWLTYAQNLAADFSRSKWPAAYPAYLWLLLRLVGPFHVFLANLPLLMLIFWFVGRITDRAARMDGRDALPFVGALAMALLLMLDPAILVHMTNPYRDPLSHVFLLASMVLFLGYLAGPMRSPWRIGLAGLFLGLAVSVREPAVLAGIPMLACGLAWRWKDQSIPLWPSLAAFAAGAVVGILPLLIQMYLFSDQLFLPPQAVAESKLLPGMHGQAFGKVVQVALQRYYLQGGMWPLVLPVLGVVAAARRRNLPLLLLLFPLAALYTVFYSYYWTFVSRYFYIVNLFAAPLAAVGLCELAARVMGILKRPAWAARACAVLALAAAAAAGARMARTEFPEHPFRVPDARRLARDLEAVLPRGSTVLAPRHLCEVMRYFVGFDAYPIQAFSRGQVPVDHDMAAGLEELLASRERVYLAEVFDSRGDHDGGGRLARQYLDTHPVAVFTNARYNLAAICADHHGHFVLHRLVPWRETVAESVLPADAPSEGVLQVDAGMLWHQAASRTRARLLVNGQVLAERVNNGLNYFRLPSDMEEPLVLRLESDQPVPGDLAAVLHPPNEPLDFPLKPGTVPSATAPLGEGDWAFRHPWSEWYGFTNRARLNLPVEWAGEEEYVIEIRLRLPEKRKDPARVRLLDEEGRLLAEDAIPGDGAFHSLCARTRNPDAVSVRPLRLEEADLSGVVVEIGRVSLYPLARAHPVSVRFGTPADEPFVQAGLYNRESDQDRSFRWTTGEATLKVFAPAGVESLRLRLIYSDRLRPASAPTANLELRWNGAPIDFQVLQDEGEEGSTIVEAMVRAGSDANPFHLFTLACTPWTPKDYGGRDARVLGIMLHRMELTIAGR